MSYTARMLRYLAVPATPSELSVVLDVPLRNVRARLYQLRDRDRVEQLSNVVPCASKRGRRYEHLWQRAA